MKSTPPELDLITDVVLAYRPKPKTKAEKRRIRRKKREEKQQAKLNLPPTPLVPA
jgi:hypothetical protein